MNRHFLRASVTALLVALTLASCASSSGDRGEQTGKPMAELVGPDKDLQKRRAVSAYVAAGMEALRLKDSERARKHITRALKIDSRSAEANNAMALFYRIDVDDAREEKYYRKALRYDANFSQARNNYAALLYRQARYKEAVEQLERAVNDPHYDQRSIAALNLGRCYEKLGEFEKAVLSFQRSLRLDSAQLDAMLELADSYLSQKKYDDSRSYLTAYLSRARQTARSLWIGIRLEKALGDVNKVSGYELQLDGMFKGSAEHSAWQAWKGGGSPAVKLDGNK